VPHSKFKFLKCGFLPKAATNVFPAGSFMFRLPPFVLCRTSFGLRISVFGFRVNPFAFRLPPFVLLPAPFVFQGGPFVFRFRPFVLAARLFVLGIRPIVFRPSPFADFSRPQGFLRPPMPFSRGGNASAFNSIMIIISNYTLLLFYFNVFY
jgi:hypothetical protein